MASQRTNRYAVLIGLLALAQTPAFGQGTDEQREACTPDVFRLCGSYIPDADRITSCLRSNSDRLSKACYAVFNPPQSTTELRRPVQQPAPVERRPVQAPAADDDED